MFLSLASRPLAAAEGQLRSRFATLAAFFVAIGLVASLRANLPPIPAAPAGRIESGIPSFVVFGPEAIGLSTAPSDMHLLPDGRILITGQSEIAFGDGVRWETYRAAEDQSPIFRESIVDRDGQIYFGTPGAFSRLHLDSDGSWRSSEVAKVPDDPATRGKTLISISVVGDDWYWYSRSGSMVKWRPGQTAEVVPSAYAVERLFRAGEDLYVSDQGSGCLYRLGPHPERVTFFKGISSELVTASLGIEDGKALIGTYASGIQIFDGEKSVPFGEPGPLTSHLRINYLCRAGDGNFAAAIDTFGIVFFDRHGKVLQVLDSRVDHRLSRVVKLEFSPDGVMWAMLGEGVARVEFPSRMTRFEPLIPSGLLFAEPKRYEGRLWMHADGRVFRGVYDAADRLDRFVLDAPPGNFTFTLAIVDNDFFAGTDEGIYVRRGDEWRPVLIGPVNARIGITRTPDGGIVYAARGEMGVLRKRGTGFDVHRVPVAGLLDNYNFQTDSNGVAWLELGISRVGRLDPRGPELALSVYGREAGLHDGWVMISSLKGKVSFQITNKVLRFDDETRKFVEHTTLMAEHPEFATVSTRPAIDPFGRIWYSYRGRLWKTEPAEGSKPEMVEVPFNVSDYRFEDDGVIWLFGSSRVMRLDGRVAATQQAKPRTTITSIQFPNTNRQLFDVSRLARLPYVDNTLVFHFAAPSNPFASSISFQVQLEGVSDRWVPVGITGQAVYNRLKEGSYVFRVRAVTASGITGDAARVAFTIEPPWFRSGVAWLAYIVAGIATLVFSIWYPAYRQRRQKEYLEVLVTNRTEELNKSNRQLEQQIQETTQKSTALAASEERYRALSADLERRVVERTAQLSVSNEELRQRESLFRLIFEHAPVGISWKRVDLDAVHHFNQTYRQILEIATETLPDFSALTKMVHPDDLPQQVALEKQITSGEVDNGRLELRFNLPSGRLVWTSFCVAVVRNAGGQIVQVIGIIEDISARKEAERKLAATYKELLETSRMAGMAEVATGVLHNVGNVLNSLNVSANLLGTTVRNSKVESLMKLSALLNDRAADLATFLTQDPKGRLVPELLKRLAENGVGERDWLAQEIASMQKNIDHIKDIVAMQQSYATVLGVTETLDPETLFEDAIRMNAAALSRHDVRLVREFAPVPRVCVEKGKVLQILINVIRNAKYACDDGQVYGAREKVVTVALETLGDRVRFVVRDNGIGIAPENLTKIFAHGFTTRAYGHGFGLHSSALAAREMKGSIIAESEGLGKGATFILEVPAAMDAGPAADAMPAPAAGSRSPLPAT